MKRNENKYKVLTKLPANAKSVPEYAKLINCTPQSIYNRIARDKADFEIVIFQGFNFVIPFK